MPIDDDKLSDILVIESDKPAILVIDSDTVLLDQLNALFNRSPAEGGEVLIDAHFVIRRVVAQEQAVRLINEHLHGHARFNLIFAEYQLQPIDGLEMIKNIWKLDPSLNAVLYTSDPTLGWQQVVDALGESDQLLILQEPFSELEVRQIVHAMIRQWQLVKQTQSVMQFFELQNVELEAANRRLQEIQAQLLRSEKMSSIGQLAAGVAHEINNPLGFVKSNLNTFKNYTNDFLTLLAAYEQAEAAIADGEVLQTLRRLKQQIELDYLRRDVVDLLKESTEGVERVKQIVKDLKEFSHPETSGDHWRRDDLHAGLESALNIVCNELRYKADVVKEYGQLPLVNCLLSQLKQVFVNLLLNAAYAIPEHGVITIKTGCDASQVWVEIGDSGCGISEDKLNRIFDPFYTTKPVGKGTGLGLSISYAIVKKHNGDITVRSKVGEGSQFRIVLPIETERGA